MLVVPLTDFLKSVVCAMCFIYTKSCSFPIRTDVFINKSTVLVQKQNYQNMDTNGKFKAFLLIHEISPQIVLRICTTSIFKGVH